MRSMWTWVPKGGHGYPGAPMGTHGRTGVPMGGHVHRAWSQLGIPLDQKDLAKTLNREMAREEPVSTYLPVFDYFHSKFLTGDDEEKKCIEVSFVENLFWQIKSEKAEPYWQALPSSLKELYVKFHGCAPV